MADPTTPPKTGWPPGMLQDDSRELSRWLASRIDARRLAREAAKAERGGVGSGGTGRGPQD